MKTSILMAALIAAGFGMPAAMAQNVHSDADKARVEEQNMQQKETGAPSGASTERSDSSNSNATAARDSADGNAAGKPSDKAPGAGRTQNDAKAQDQSKADDEMARAENGEAKKGNTGNTPGQSQTGVGHPENAKTTGQGQGVKEQGSGTANSGTAQDGSGSAKSGSANSGSSGDTANSGNSNSGNSNGAGSSSGTGARQ